MTRERSYVIDSNEEIPYGKGRLLTLANTKVAQKGSGIPGFPDTQIFNYTSVERLFKPKYIETDPECAEYFAIDDMFVGHNKQWPCPSGSVTCKILNQRPLIDFSEVLPNQISFFQ